MAGFYDDLVQLQYQGVGGGWAGGDDNVVFSVGHRKSYSQPGRTRWSL